MRKALLDHLKDEGGAVAVDWVVLTGGLVAVGIATVATVVTGVENISNDTSITLANLGLDDRWLPVDGFDDGAGGWLGATAGYVAGFGNILGPIAGSATGAQSVSQVFSIPEGTTLATLTFDLLSIDSLDVANGHWGMAEGPVLYLNGTVIAQATSQNGVLSWTMMDVDGVTVESTEVAAQQNLGGVSPDVVAWQDGINTVTVTVENPADTMEFGLGLVANQSVQDESIGIDNFSLVTLP